MNPAYVKEALELAKLGAGQASPNPLVGALLVRDGEVVGRGTHTYSGVKHAEILALEQAGDRARGATLYINIEPCSHHGRTPPCADALIAAGVQRVVVPIEDPNPLVSGLGLKRLRDAGIEVVMALEFAAEAASVNEAFIHFMRYKRPLVTLKSALTLDGKIAAPDDNRGWITSDVARTHVQYMRHAHDAILTGIGTVIEDNPLLTDRTGLPRSRPLIRIVVDSQLRIPLKQDMVLSAERTNGVDLVLATTSVASSERRRALEARGIRVVIFDGPDGRVDLRDVVSWLGTERCLSLMIEAGSKVNWASLESGIVDKVFFYYAPKILGGTQSLSLAGGTGKRRRVDAIRMEGVQLHRITAEEFAVEARVIKG